jgi:hypothetical protein
MDRATQATMAHRGSSPGTIYVFNLSTVTVSIPPPGQPLRSRDLTAASYQYYVQLPSTLHLRNR